MKLRIQSFLPRTRSKTVFVLVMAAYSTTLDYFLAACRRAAHVPGPPPPFYASATQHPLGYIADLLILAPVIESFILIAIVELVRRFHAPTIVQALTAALFVSELHVFGWWPHALIVLPGFCIDAASYLYWRRISWRVAFVVIASIHALSNVIPATTAIGALFRRG